MKRVLLTLALASVCAVQSAWAWHYTVHEGIAAVADANLTPAAKAELEKYIDGRSIVYYAGWMDFVADKKEYADVKQWHNVPVTGKFKMLNEKQIDKSTDEAVNMARAFIGLEKAVNVIENRANYSQQEVADCIKCLINIVADLHCPTHYIYTDMTPVERAVQFYRYDAKKPTTYASFWEANAIHNTFHWRTNEYVHQLSRKSAEEVADLTWGSVVEWIERNAAEYRSVYSLVKDGQRLPEKPSKNPDEMMYRLWLNPIYPRATEYAAVAGYRTAALLNSLFDADAPKIALTGKTKKKK